MSRSCWKCHRDSPDSLACGWCGVWLVKLNPGAVPPSLQGLLPLAQEWGVNDDGYRATAVAQADTETLTSLVAAVDKADDASLSGWLAGSEADLQSPSAEYLALTALIMAADHARELLSN
jgi:hypothetical protein